MKKLILLLLTVFVLANVKAQNTTVKPTSPAPASFTPQLSYSGSDSLRMLYLTIPMVGTNWMFTGTYINKYFLHKSDTTQSWGFVTQNQLADSLANLNFYPTHDFTGLGTATSKFRISDDTIGTGHFIVRNTLGYLRSDTNHYFPQYLVGDLNVHQNGHNLTFDGPLLFKTPPTGSNTDNILVLDGDTVKQIPAGTISNIYTANGTTTSGVDRVVTIASNQSLIFQNSATFGNTNLTVGNGQAEIFSGTSSYSTAGIQLSDLSVQLGFYHNGGVKSALLLGPGSADYRDDINHSWMFYDTDYSSASSSNPRSIPDLGYIQNNFATTASATPHNGLQSVSGGIGLGGTVAAPTTITMGTSAKLQFTGHAGEGLILISSTSSTDDVQLYNANNAGTYYSKIDLNQSALSMQSTVNSGGATQSITMDASASSGITVKDAVNSKGLIGYADYSTNELTSGLYYAQMKAVRSVVSSDSTHSAATYQTALVSGTSIKTVNSTSLLGSGNLAITPSNTDTTSTGFATRLLLNNYLTKATAASIYAQLAASNTFTQTNNFTGIIQTGNIIVSGGSTNALHTINGTIASASGATGQNTGVYSGVTAPNGIASIDQIDGGLFALYSQSGGTIAMQKGIETGYDAVTNNTTITTNYGLEIATPSVAAGSSIGTHAYLHIAGGALTNIGTAYSVYSETSAPGIFKGPLTVGNQSFSTTFTPSLTLNGYDLSSSSSPIGDYGYLIFNSNGNQTALARPNVLTNAFQNMFALLIGPNATTLPTLTTGGALATGTVGFAVDRNGNFFLPQYTSNGILQTSGGTGQFTVSNTLPNGTTATTQSAGDNSTKVATTAYVDGGLSGKQATFTSTSETPSGSVNGSNTSFTISHTPLTGTFQLYYNGMIQTSGTDYTISGTSITYLYAPTSGTLKATYQY